jgi:hypothetical protein
LYKGKDFWFYDKRKIYKKIIVNRENNRRIKYN